MQNIQTSEDKFDSDDGNVASLIIRLDQKYQIMERKIYHLLELLESAGGLKEALHHIGLVFVGYFCQKLFLTHIMH